MGFGLHGLCELSFRLKETSIEAYGARVDFGVQGSGFRVLRFRFDGLGSLGFQVLGFWVGGLGSGDVSVLAAAEGVQGV